MAGDHHAPLVPGAVVDAVASSLAIQNESIPLQRSTELPDGDFSKLRRDGHTERVSSSPSGSSESSWDSMGMGSPWAIMLSR